LLGIPSCARPRQQPGLLILGDISIQSHIIKPVRSLVEPLQVAMDNRTRHRAAIPIENKNQFLEVNPDILEQVDPNLFR